MKKLLASLTLAGLALSVAAQIQTADSKLEWAAKTVAAEKSMAATAE